jgi:LysM repeat protein
MTLPRHTVFALLAVALSFGGCVMTEKYEAEKARALNFQRLLAQEEKRTGELDSELKRVKRENPELEARNRELAAQLQAVREQLARVQEETNALREAAALREHQDRSPGSRSRRGAPPAAAKHPIAPAPPPTPAETPMDLKAEQGSPVYHEVKPGETLFRLSKQYGVNVDTIRHWNHLEDDLIEVGQKLVVGYR